ncbi:molybdopterin-dependent oxidoreductase [Nocardioides sp.]|uniref:molybdopterin-dependent oxidoreductase n=1 Tax=Nocardioides sp. TaxID=35761 RepID=UPI0037851F37
MTTSRGPWALAGVVAGYAGLATSYCVASLATAHGSAVVAVADLVIRETPGPAAEQAIQLFRHHDKTALVIGVLVILTALFAWAGVLARRGWAGPLVVYGVLALVGVVAVATQRGESPVEYVALAVGLLTWIGALALMTGPLRSPAPVAASEPAPGSTRRGFLLRVGAVAVVAVAVGAAGRAVGASRRQVEQARRLLRLPGITKPEPPAGSSVGVPGMPPWETPNDEFYRIDTAIVVPAVEPDGWRLRIHGLVDREVELSYQDLVDQQDTEAWVTICCVSNEVGGDLIGNAWWGGVRIAELLRRAGVQGGADAVLQTSADGWTCGTPLAVLTDDRDAMLAIAMNGEPLPIEHGFPVRTIVPGLYGYVSACKWVVDLEVTRFSEISAYWTERGWSELGPVKMSSRIDVPRDGGDVAASGGRVAGVAWAQHTGIAGVEVSVDEGDWQPAELARVPSADTWVQWAATIDVEPGDHTVRVRATDEDGLVQTGESQDVVPDGATGWHSVRFTATG